MPQFENFGSLGKLICRGGDYDITPARWDTYLKMRQKRVQPKPLIGTILVVPAQSGPRLKMSRCLCSPPILSESVEADYRLRNRKRLNKIKNSISRAQTEVRWSADARLWNWFNELLMWLMSDFSHFQSWEFGKIPKFLRSMSKHCTSKLNI